MQKLGGKSQSGFTLIEIMVAMLLLLVLAAGFVPLFLTGLSQTTAVRYKSLATNIAREKLEQIRALDYREVLEDKANPSDPRNLSNRFGTSAEVRGIPFQISYDVGVTQYETGTLKLVTVTVTWQGPPKPQPVRLTTLIHQQYVGPRGALLAFTPTYPDDRGTPFPRLTGNTTARYYVAQIDWGLVFDNFDQPGMTPKQGVYMRLFLTDDAGVVWPLGPKDQDYKLGTSDLKYTKDHDGKVTSVYYEYSLNASDIPDGYWNAKAVIYNQYDEPGNVWTLRIRIDEDRAPAVPQDVTVTALDDHTVQLQWKPGQERDRAYWIIERDKMAEGAWSDLWVRVISDLSPWLSAFTDEGSVVDERDPWGTTDVTNLYRYRIWAVDIDGLEGDMSPPLEISLPPTETTTTTSISTSTISTTTSTTVAHIVKVKNTTNKQWSIEIRNSQNVLVDQGEVKNGQTWTSSPLSDGQYTVTAYYRSETRMATFTIPDDSGKEVLVIAW